MTDLYFCPTEQRERYLHALFVRYTGRDFKTERSEGGKPYRVNIVVEISENGGAFKKYDGEKFDPRDSENELSMRIVEKMTEDFKYERDTENSMNIVSAVINN